MHIADKASYSKEKFSNMLGLNREVYKGTDESELLESHHSQGSVDLHNHEINDLITEIRRSKADLNWHKFKTLGIEPGHLNNKDVAFYFELIDNETRYSSSCDHHKAIAFWDHLVIDHKGCFYTIWRPLYVCSCLVSSYVYAYLACFESAHQVTEFRVLEAVFEGIFFISIIIEFLASYENPNKKGDKIKSVEKSARRYVYGNFIRDLIPVLPL